MSGQRPPRLPNQAAPVGDHDAWAADPSLRWWLRDAAPTADAGGLLGRVGLDVGSARLRAAADLANARPPRLATWDRAGRRIDDVEFDRSWHETLDAVTSSGVCGLPWLDSEHGYVVRAAAMELWARLDIGVMCPVTMTTAAMPVLARDADGGGRELLGAILTAARAGLDGTESPHVHPTVGMAMTEPQGGSDVSGTATVATPAPDGTHRLDGHKWFCSHPVADALLVLAREEGAGIGCFLVPGWLPDGERNGIELQRLKDKLGTRSLASAEVVLRGAHGARIGEPGRGVATIMEMVVHTRMDCTIGSAGVVARAVGEAVHHARGRSAFGSPLVDQPLMRMVLADLLLEREASLACAFEVARCFQHGDAAGRLVTPIAKYWVTRRAVAACVEAVEVLGGNGYTAEFVVERLYRDAQVNSTWEGSGNVMALDVLRAMTREPELVDALGDRIATLIDGAPDDVASAIEQFARGVAAPAGPRDARRFAGRMALAVQAALLAHRAAAGGDADELVARAFVATRLAASPERVLGDGDVVLADAAEVLLARAPVPTS